jgi:hypothetical protein
MSSEQTFDVDVDGINPFSKRFANNFAQVNCYPLVDLVRIALRTSNAHHRGEDRTQRPAKRLKTIHPRHCHHTGIAESLAAESTLKILSEGALAARAR